jgi:hypothetical protein
VNPEANGRRCMTSSKGISAHQAIGNRSGRGNAAANSSPETAEAIKTGLIRCITTNVQAARQQQPLTERYEADG